MEYFIPENIHITCMDKLKTPPPSPSSNIQQKFDLPLDVWDQSFKAGLTLILG